MTRKKFTLWHSLAGTGLLLILEAALLSFWQESAAGWLIAVTAITGSVITIYVSTEIIEEVRGAMRMLTLLSVVVAELVVFFSFQYWFLLQIEPASFPTLGNDGTTLLLHSVMVFVFNPLYLPGTGMGRMLLLINTLAALGLVMFILQNVGQFRSANSN